MKSGWALVVPVAVLVAGCTPAAPSTSAPSSTPTFMCTPEAGGTESACSQQEFDKMKAKDEQYAKAEKVYREYQAEYERVVRAGGATSLSPKLEQSLGDPALRKSLLRQLREFRAERLRIEGPGVEIKSVVRRPGVEMKGSTVALQFCLDGSATKVMRKQEKVRTGGIAKETAFFALAESRFQIVATTYQEVKSCTD